MVVGGIGIGYGVVVMAMAMVALLMVTMVVVAMMIMVATMGQQLLWHNNSVTMMEVSWKTIYMFLYYHNHKHVVHLVHARVIRIKWLFLLKNNNINKMRCSIS